MIFFIAPSGGNNSYICLKLIGTNIDGMTTYHAKGTHSDEKQIIKTIRSCAHNANKIDVREATKNVLNKFSLNKAVQIHLKIYDELLSNDL